MGQMHISQYDIQIANGAKQDTGKSTATKASLEEALSIQRAHSQYRMAAYTLTILASAHRNLRIFDGARSTSTMLSRKVDIASDLCNLIESFGAFYRLWKYVGKDKQRSSSQLQIACSCPDL